MAVNRYYLHKSQQENTVFALSESQDHMKILRVGNSMQNNEQIDNATSRQAAQTGQAGQADAPVPGGAFGRGRPVRRVLQAWLGDLDLRSKLMLGFFLVVVVPLVASSLLMMMAFRQLTLENAVSESRGNVARVRQLTQETITAAIDLSNRISLDAEVSKVALGQYATYPDAVRALRAFTGFDEYEFYLNWISRIKLYVPNATLLNNWQFIPLDSRTMLSWWYRSAYNHPGMCGWVYFADASRREGSALSLVRYITLAGSSQGALLVLDLDTDNLNARLAREPFDTIVLDGNGMVVASNIPARVGRPLAESLAVEGFKFQPGETWDREVAGKPSRIFVEELLPDNSYNSLRIVSIMSLESIMGSADRVSLGGALLILASFVLAIVAIYVLSGIMSSRMSRLASQVRQFGEGNFLLPTLEEGNDEIGLLSRQFNHMVADIRRLMDQVAETREQKFLLEKKNLEIRLSMLTSQINPHFLYNALESVRMKAVLAGEKEIARTVKLLGRLLRKKLELANEFVPLAEELRMVGDYLEIQKFRHGPGLEFLISVPEDCLGQTVPAFILQPLVENAVLHGLERKVGGGRIQLTAVLDGPVLSLAVQDDGLGMEPAALDNLRLALAEGTLESIGIRNVHERLELLYGEGHGLTIQSTAGQGTCVSFCIPREVA